MGVDTKRNARIGMPKHGLRSFDVLAISHEQSRKRVPKRMPGDVLGDSRALGCAA
jgi:hypothetical protein